MDPAILSRILSTYAPNSAGTQDQLVASSLAALDALPSLLSAVADRERIFETSIDEFSRHVPAQAIEEFGEVFLAYGSDKSTLHDYHKLYAALLHRSRHDVRRVVEIGIGTNDPNLLSTMGVQGKPGASLRAFESLLPRSGVIGADIDEKILFRSGRIWCVSCDQTHLEGFNSLREALAGRPADLLIDDGLHAVHANLHTLLFGLDVVAPGGHVVIEDIPHHFGWFWKVLAGLLQRRHDCTLVRCRSALAFVVRT